MSMAALVKRWVWLPLLCGFVIAGCGGSNGEASAPRASVDVDKPSSTSAVESLESTTSTTAMVVPTTMAEQHFEPLYADPALTPEEQVEAAYLFSWEIYYYAASRGDTTYVPLAYAYRGLELVTEEVEGYAENRQTQTGSSELNYGLDVYAEGEAVVVDFWHDNLVLISLEDGSEINGGHGKLSKTEFYLELIDGQWLVTEIRPFVG